MNSTINESERARKQYAALAAHYGQIGPAAIIAALLCMPRKTVRNATVVTRAA